eukprot:TRINITY_DN29405_c4_g1_i1.p2 TRINITY_DN29405_c4_g1~~TRINITY_DN29405_c4_g1_i1.p2  ORF type:complete len:831 (+),score=336.30 TRINITY_DN29405_c4_g1_i1:197-2494(+)
MAAAAFCCYLAAVLLPSLAAAHAKRPVVVAVGARPVVHFGHHGRRGGRHPEQDSRHRRMERAFNVQFSQNVRSLKAILHRKLLLEQVLNEEIALLQGGKWVDSQTGKPVVDPAETERKLWKRRLRKRMLDELEQGVMNKAQKLDALMRNLTDENLRKDSRDRLAQLQEESVRAREDYAQATAMERAEKEDLRRRQVAAPNATDGAVGKMLRSVDAELGRAVGEVQHEMDSDAAWAHALAQRARGGAEMETVVKVVDRGRHAIAHSAGDHAEVGIVSTLIDHDNNRYVLARPHDSSIHYEDEHLIYDLVRVASFGLAGASAAQFLGLPLFFGYIAGGTVLSPTQLNMLHNLVQMETLAQIGVYLMLFLLGVEFSLDKVRRVFRPAVCGGLAAMALTTCTALGALLLLFNAHKAEGVLIGFCFSLSSTAVVLKCISEGELAAPFGRILLGVLVVQDVSLGVMVAVIPLLDGGAGGNPLHACAALAAALAALGAATALFASCIAAPYLRFCAQSPELFVLGLTALCFLAMSGAQELGLSMEVGAFATGLALASTGREWPPRVIAAMRPLQDFFAVIFFAAIGFHIYPSFLMRELGLLLSVTLLVVGIKYLIGVFVFGVLCRVELHDASLVALGLSQMSEFSFVIAAHGKAQGLINREVYFMLLGTTALSLTTTPLLWRLHDRRPGQGAAVPPPPESKAAAAAQAGPGVGSASSARSGGGGAVSRSPSSTHQTPAPQWGPASQTGAPWVVAEECEPAVRQHGSPQRGVG